MLTSGLVYRCVHGRPNLLENEFSAILMDRGGQVLLDGDAYVAQAAALAAFGNWDLSKRISIEPRTILTGLRAIHFIGFSR